MSLRLSKKNLYAVLLSQFASRCGISVREAAELAELANAASRTAVRSATTMTDRNQDAHRRAMDRFNLAAKELRLTPQWNGVKHSIMHNGEVIYFPS